MTNTLVERLREIDKDPSFVEVERKIIKRNLLILARKDYPLIDEEIERRSSILDVVNTLSKKYGGWRVLLPKFRDEEYDRKLNNLKLDEIINADALKPTSQKLSRIFPYYIGGFLVFSRV